MCVLLHVLATFFAQKRSSVELVALTFLNLAYMTMLQFATLGEVAWW